MAQRLAQGTHNPWVVGSNPTGPTKNTATSRQPSGCRLVFFRGEGGALARHRQGSRDVWGGGKQKGPRWAALGLWSGRRGSNPRPQPWQGCALPTEPLPQKVEATTGIEPVIKALQASALPLGHVASHARLGEKSRLGKPAPYIQWSGRRGSNPRPQPWQGCALPTEPLPRAQADTIKEGCGLCKKKFEKSRPCTDPDPGRCMLAAKKLKKGLARICGCCIVSPRR